MLGHESVSGRRHPGPGHSGEAACQNTLVFDPLLPLFSDALSVPVVILIFPRLLPLFEPFLSFFALLYPCWKQGWSSAARFHDCVGSSLPLGIQLYET